MLGFCVQVTTYDRSRRKTAGDRIKNTIRALHYDDACMIAAALSTLPFESGIERRVQLVCDVYVGGQHLYIPTDEMRRFAGEIGGMLAEFENRTKRRPDIHDLSEVEDEVPGEFDNAAE